MHPLYDIIRNRRSIKPGSFQRKSVELDKIQRLVEAANAAPTHKKIYPWRFVAFATKSGKQELSDFLSAQKADKKGIEIDDALRQKMFDKVDKSGALIAIIMNPTLSKLPEWEEVAATSCAVQNLALAAVAEGLGGYWSSPGKVWAQADELFKLKEGEKCLGIFYLGYPKEGLKVKAINRPSVEEKLEFR